MKKHRAKIILGVIILVIIIICVLLLKGCKKMQPGQSNSSESSIESSLVEESSVESSSIVESSSMEESSSIGKSESSSHGSEEASKNESSDREESSRKEESSSNQEHSSIQEESSAESSESSQSESSRATSSSQHESSSQEESSSHSTSSQEESSVPVHVHDWQPVFKQVEREVIYDKKIWVVDKEEWDEEVEEEQYGFVLCCNMCDEIFMDVSALIGHQEKTEHMGHHDSWRVVSLIVQVIRHDEEGHYETVSRTRIDLENVLDYAVCSCGERKYPD